MAAMLRLDWQVGQLLFHCQPHLYVQLYHVQHLDLGLDAQFLCHLTEKEAKIKI